jgi:hypothetical protein
LIDLVQIHSSSFSCRRSSKEQKLENRKNRPKESSTSTSKSYQLLPKISNQTLDEEDENLDDLDEDDLALGSGDDDDIDLLSDMPSSGSGNSFSGKPFLITAQLFNPPDRLS